MSTEQRLFMRCNACHGTTTGTAGVDWNLTYPAPAAGYRVDHWPCSTQEHGYWVPVLLLRHDWQRDRLGDIECKRCGAWTAGFNTPPDYGCADPTARLPVVQSPDEIKRATALRIIDQMIVDVMREHVLTL